MRSFYFILFFILLSEAVFSQQLKIDPNVKYPSAADLSQQDKLQVVKATENLLKEYGAAMTLLDPAAKRVNGTSIDKFKSLFIANARIEKDYEQFPPTDLVGINEYVSGVFNRLGIEGLKVRIEHATLKEIRNDASGFFVVIVEAEKDFYNYVTSDQRVKEVASGRRSKQEIRIDIPKRDLMRPRIAKIGRTSINGNGGGNNLNPAEYVRFIGPSIGLSFPSVNTTPSAFWTANRNNAQLDVSGSGFSIGLSFITNSFASKSSTKKNLFFTSGLYYESQTLTATIDDFIIDGISAVATNGNSLSYERLVGIVGDQEMPLAVEEKIKLGAIKIPLGLGIRIIQSEKIDFLLSASIIPTLNISSSGDLNGIGHYDGRIRDAMWQFLEFNASKASEPNLNQDFLTDSDGLGPFQVGPNQEIQGSSVIETNGFTLGGQLSPTFFFQLARANPTWALMVGLDLNFQFGSTFQHEPQGEDIQTLIFPNSEYNTNLLSHYLEDSSIFSPTLKIGFVRRIARKP